WGRMWTLSEVSDELSGRLAKLFLRDESGRRPVFGDRAFLQADPAWRDLVPFHEYFHGDTGAGLGASHQTGWTGLVADLIIRGTSSRRHARETAPDPQLASPGHARSSTSPTGRSSTQHSLSKRP